MNRAAKWLIHHPRVYATAALVLAPVIALLSLGSIVRKMIEDYRYELKGLWDELSDIYKDWPGKMIARAKDHQEALRKKEQKS